MLVGTGLRAVEHGLRVRYATAADLIEQLYRGLADNTVGRTIAGLLRSDVVLIDEVGFAPLDETGMQLLFRLIAERYERRSVAISTNLVFRTGTAFSKNQVPGNAPVFDRNGNEVTITDRAHPLFGQTLPVVYRKSPGRRDHVLVQLPSGVRRAVR